MRWGGPHGSRRPADGTLEALVLVPVRQVNDSKNPFCYRTASGGDGRLLTILLTRIVVRIQVFEAQRTDGRHLGDVLTGFCPMEVRLIAGQNNDGADTP
jgi:hypothetical protein